MGGINHRPTKGVSVTTALSAQCAWAIGQAITNLWQANGELEKAIISATGKTDIARHIDGVTGDAVSHLERAIAYLYATLDGVHTTIHAYDDLLTLTDELGYKGNPFAPQIREWNLRELLEQHLFLIRSREMWDDIASRIEQHNLVEYFKWERDQFYRVIKPLQDLIQVMNTCKEVAAVDPDLFVKSVEFNQIPLRQYFFRVFNLWSSLVLMVEVSTSISTELFYRVEGNGSLTEVPPIPTRDDILREAPARVPAVW
ncbi:MAG: hypothetical protein BSOLF_2578 [Candidatus Carbobacillus altaicus]|uniref:Uncharacterized protein n=1 Tax=Candidatus Carbonibacillus altaicus TaxID=2163959 RepID=A0A2R6Y2P2_9BACL|nr:MAG: hypothetical protein BSOLF_2578 [Candidatus Carbobacillus altaicus]